MYIKLEDVVVVDELQGRVGTMQNKVDEYAELYDEGTKFPPVSVMVIDKKYYLIDGFHRVAALTKLGEYEVEADVVEGSTLDDAKLASWAANKSHGIPRTQADKRRTIEEMLASPLTSDWSDRQIAKHAGVSHVFVWRMRSQSKEHAETPEVVHRVERQAPVQVKEPELKDEAPQESEMVKALVEENDRLRESIALNTMSEEDRDQGKSLIDDLKAEVKLLKVELEAVKRSRDTFQAENAQLKKQVSAQQRKIKQLEGK